MTITHIPSDVLHLIAPHLNTYDLVACLQVDRVWNSVFVIHLWRTIDDSQQPWRRLLAEFTDPIPTYYHPQARLVERVPERLLDLVMKYGHHIRRLVVRRPQTVELCLRARDIARMAQRQERTERSLAESLSSSAIIAAPSPTQTAVAGEVATGVGTGVGMVDVDREIREILPCESITVLRFGFLDPVLTFLKRLDRRDSPETPYLTALSAILRKNQRELEPSLTSIHPCLFYQEHDAVDSKLHMVTLARSCWQLVLNNPQLQELDMGPFGAHEDTFFVSGGYLKSTLTSCQRLRALRVGVERTPDFLVRLPTMLPNLKLLWYYDNSPLSLDALVEAAKETRESGAAVAAGQKTTEGVTSDSDERERMPNLRLLDIVAPSQPRHLAAIFSCFPDLAMLSLGVLSMDDAGVSRSGTAAAKTYSDATVLPLQDLGTNLIELHVACWDCPPTILSNSNIHLNSVTRLHLHVISGYKNLLNLLRTFPTLRELQLKKVRTLTDEIEPSYETELPLSTLKSIRLAKEAFATERSLNGLLSLLPNLTEANLYTTHPNTFSSMAAHCPLIEILEFTNKNHINSQLSLLLTRCSKLKSCIGPGLQIAYQDILDHPWICRGLQRLDCQIMGMPYITEAEQASIRYIRSHYSQIIPLPLTFDMPRPPNPNAASIDDKLWDIWHPDEQLALLKYFNVMNVLGNIYDCIVKYTDLDTVQQNRTVQSSFTQTLWTSSKRGRPVSSFGRPLKATSRVLSDSQTRWMHLPL